MKQFDINRFATLLKWHLVGNRREIMNVFFGLTIGFFIIMLFFTQVIDINVNGKDDGYYANQVHNGIAAVLFAINLFAVVGAARIFSNMKQTRQRTTFLTLPASNLEKWLLRFLHATVLLFVLCCAALVAADVLRMVIAPLWGKPLVSGVAWLFTSEGSGLTAAQNAEVPLFIAIAVGVWLLHHSIYVLGGTLFRKNPFLLTCAAISFLTLLMGHVILWVKYSGWMQQGIVLKYDSEGLIVHPIVYAATAVHYVLAVLFYWLSYKLFCRMQVINNKWLNL